MAQSYKQPRHFLHLWVQTVNPPKWTGLTCFIPEIAGFWAFLSAIEGEWSTLGGCVKITDDFTSLFPTSNPFPHFLVYAISFFNRESHIISMNVMGKSMANPWWKPVKFPWNWVLFGLTECREHGHLERHTDTALWTLSALHADWGTDQNGSLNGSLGWVKSWFRKKARNHEICETWNLGNVPMGMVGQHDKVGIVRLTGNSIQASVWSNMGNTPLFTVKWEKRW